MSEPPASAGGSPAVGGQRSSVAPRAPRAERDESSYIIRAFAKGLQVFECFEGRNFAPVTIQIAAQRTGYPRFFCMAALITLKKFGWVKEVIEGKERAFVLGPRFERLARQYAVTALARP